MDPFQTGFRTNRQTYGDICTAHVHKCGTAVTPHKQFHLLWPTSNRNLGKLFFFLAWKGNTTQSDEVKTVWLYYLILFMRHRKTNVVLIHIWGLFKFILLHKCLKFSIRCSSLPFFFFLHAINFKHDIKIQNSSSSLLKIGWKTLCQTTRCCVWLRGDNVVTNVQSNLKCFSRQCANLDIGGIKRSFGYFG